MNPWLSKAAKRLRNDIDLHFPERDKRSDGWLGDAKHQAEKSDHNPDKSGCVRAIDIDSNISMHKSTAIYLAEQIRVCAKKDKRIAYVIYNGKIASPIMAWKWRKYRGVNPHTSHIHISFTKKGDLDSKSFEIPMLKEQA